MNALQYLVGTDQIGFFIAKLLLGYIGAFLLVLWGAKKAAANSPRTPDKFSMDYLWNDNSKRFIANLIVIYLGVRFMSQLMPPAASEELELIMALTVGITVDSITAKLKKWRTPENTTQAGKPKD